MSVGTPLLWIAFNLFVLAMLAIDLGVFNREAHEVSLREAATWSAVWISLALLFDLGIYFWQGTDVALQFLTGYLIEKSLSVDNIFVFVLIFSTFAVPAAYHHRVLFWGVLGALVLRGLLIGLGTALVGAFHWVLFLFGAFLVLTGVRMARHEQIEIQPSNNPIVRALRRVVPITPGYEDGHFFVARDGLRYATPLLVVLVLIETTDLVFALDSIPAIFAITLDPFIVYTSNVFAILGLRSLYFLLAGSVQRFGYLRYGLAAVLIFVGAKMLLADIYHVPIGTSLAVIAVLLAIAIVASVLWPPHAHTQRKQEPTPHIGPGEHRRTHHG